jgi:hypothetical protein
MVPGPMLVLKLRGAGIPLVVRFFTPGVGVAETEGRRISWEVRDVVGVEMSRSSSMRHILPMLGSWPAWLLRDERGRRLSVVGFVE